MAEPVQKEVCEERHKALENYLSNDKTKLIKHDGEMKTVQEALIVLTEIQAQQREEIKDHEGRLRGIEAKPAKRWDSITAQIIQLNVAAATGGFIGKMLGP